MRNIVLADNQNITNAGLKFIIFEQFGSIELKEVTSKGNLISILTEIPDSFVILDYTIFDFESVNELVILQNRFYQVDWLLFSDELSNAFLQILLYNTHSFSVLMKDSHYEEIVTALRESMQGNRFISNYVSNLLLDTIRKSISINSKQLLTLTEQEILKEMALGKTTKEIAALRFVSTHTVMTHRKNIFHKIEVNNVHEATKYAIRAGIVDIAEYYI